MDELAKGGFVSKNGFWIEGHCDTEIISLPDTPKFLTDEIFEAIQRTLPKVAEAGNVVVSINAHAESE